MVACALCLEWELFPTPTVTGKVLSCVDGDLMKQGPHIRGGPRTFVSGTAMFSGTAQNVNEAE